MKLFITGICGFVGSSLASWFTNSGLLSRLAGSITSSGPGARSIVRICAHEESPSSTPMFGTPQKRIETLRPIQNLESHGFGRAVVLGFDHAKGDALVIMMADESDDCRDVVRYWQGLNSGYDCVFGSRFLKGGGVIDYPWLKLWINRCANLFIRTLFRIKPNDITNAFKAYRREVIAGCRPFLSPHFNLTVEIPLKAIVRGYTWTVIPVTWRNRRTGTAKLKINEMGSRYLFICLYVWLEKYFSKGDYQKKSSEATEG